MQSLAEDKGLAQALILDSRLSRKNYILVSLRLLGGTFFVERGGIKFCVFQGKMHEWFGGEDFFF